MRTKIILAVVAMFAVFSVNAAQKGNPHPAATLSNGQTGADGNQRPNVVLIMADDMGYECVGAYGSKQYHTPQLDKLAGEGILFTHCYSNPLCTPTRVKLMTGLYNHRNYKHFGILPRKSYTFGHMMQEAGYTTCMAGKWQLGTINPENYSFQSEGSYPGDTGFDQWISTSGNKRHHYWDPANVFANGKRVEVEEGAYGPDICCDFVVNFIEAQTESEKPFFVYYPLKLPHFPFHPTPDSEDKTIEESTENFSDMVTYVDKLVGRVVHALDETGMRENTIVLFTGDNGTHPKFVSRLGDREIQGDKGQFTDGGTRVPFIASWPGKTPPGTVCDDLVDFTDYYATLSDVAGRLKAEDDRTDGVSFLPQLKGEKGHPREWAFVFQRDLRSFEGGRHFPSNYWARTKRWKLYSDGRLFDIETDVLEENPMMPADDSRETAAVREKLQAVFTELEASPADLDPELSR